MRHLYSLEYREIDKDKSAEENFIDALNAERRARVELYKGIDIYWHLFKMLYPYCPTFLFHVLKDYKEAPDWWFYNFHKQFRQLDMYDGIGFFDRKISKEDNKKRTEILRENEKYCRKNKPNYEDFESADEWLKKEKEFFENDTFLKESKAKLRPLNTLYHSFEMKESFCGNMNMVMWLTIDNDRKNALSRFMDEFLRMYFNLKPSDF